MPKYEFEWTEELWFRAKIEGKDKQDAIDKFFTGDYPEYTGLEPYGSEIQNSIDITELEDN